jgi:transcriptional regulator with XRE-family HTH domain
MSQGQLAARMGTQQPAIARIESGRGSVSTRTLQKLAEALDATVRVTMEPVEEVDLARRSLNWWERGTAAGQREEPAMVIEGRLHITVAAQAGPSEAFALLSSSASRTRREFGIPDVRRYTAAALHRTSDANDGEAQDS